MYELLLTPRHNFNESGPDWFSVSSLRCITLKVQTESITLVLHFGPGLGRRLLNKGGRSSRRGLKITGSSGPVPALPLSHLQPSPPSPALRTHRRLRRPCRNIFPSESKPTTSGSLPQHLSFRIPAGGSFRCAVPPAPPRVLLPPRESPWRTRRRAPSVPSREGGLERMRGPGSGCEPPLCS